jgi:hypothetical protein
MNIKSIVSNTIILFGSSLVTLTYAQNQVVTCPTLTANDVENVLNNGTIATNQGYTLADAAGKTRAQVLIDEPTSNPFDTFYGFSTIVFDKNYMISIESVLGKASYEAKERAKKILLNDEKNFNGVYDQQEKVCIYKKINASPSIPNYPFKTKHETVELTTILFNEGQIPQSMMKKHHA